MCMFPNPTNTKIYAAKKKRIVVYKRVSCRVKITSKNGEIKLQRSVEAPIRHVQYRGLLKSPVISSNIRDVASHKAKALKGWRVEKGIHAYTSFVSYIHRATEGRYIYLKCYVDPKDVIAVNYLKEHIVASKITICDKDWQMIKDFLNGVDE